MQTTRTLIQRLLLALFICFTTPSHSSENALQVYTRDTVSLNGAWKTIVDPYENGFYNYRYKPFDQQETPPASAFFTDSKMTNSTQLIEYDFDQADSLEVPGDWNTQSDKLYYYEGSVWYRKKFDVQLAKNTDRSFLYFGGMNYRADVYLNGKKLGVHIGGFTPFHYEVTDLVKPEGNSLVIKVDNKRHAEAVPTLNTDWWNYGGITRDVKLVVVPKVFIRDFSIALTSAQTKQVIGNVVLDGAQDGEEVSISIPELELSQKLTTDKSGSLKFEFNVPSAQLWSPDTPKLYQVEFASEHDQLTDKIGFRTIATRGKQLLLNDKPIFLRGISVHEEYSAKGKGRVRNVDDARELLQWAASLNSNFVRLAHYPHNEHMVRQAEEMGILVWSEIPVYWTIDWNNLATYQNAETQLSEMIGRDKNRAAVIIWSLANETPVSELRNDFLAKLASKARTLDNTRLLSAAMEKHYKEDDAGIAMVEDPLAELVDIVSFNQYIGWYDGLPDKADQVNWEIPYDKPVFVSEFGGGALAGYHGDSNTIWTEEFQEKLYIKNLAMLNRIDGLVGLSPWILADFRSPRRLLTGIQNDFNRKGVLSNTGEKKKAFFVLRDFYESKR